LKRRKREHDFNGSVGFITIQAKYFECFWSVVLENTVLQKRKGIKCPIA
jgi:hypothetical protein